MEALETHVNTGNWCTQREVCVRESGHLGTQAAEYAKLTPEVTKWSLHVMLLDAREIRNMERMGKGRGGIQVQA